MQQDIFFYCCVPSLLCTCAWRDACVCVYVCGVPLCIIISLVQSFATFRFVWFGFVLVFVFMLLFFRLPSLRHSSIIHIDFFCFSPLPTPPALLCSFSLFFAVRKCSLLIFLYFVVCSLASSPAIHM